MQELNNKQILAISGGEKQLDITDVASTIIGIEVFQHITTLSLSAFYGKQGEFYRKPITIPILAITKAVGAYLAYNTAQWFKSE